MTETRDAAGGTTPGDVGPAARLCAVPDDIGVVRRSGMTRNEAERLVERSRLKSGERAVMHALLRRADNRTCEIPDQFAPKRQKELAQQAGLSERQTRRVLRHLELHGWLSVKSGLGSGNKTSCYRLFPRTPDQKCSCAKGADKSGHHVPFSGSDKGGHSSLEKGTPCPTKADIKTGISPVQNIFSAEGIEGKRRGVDTKAGYGTMASEFFTHCEECGGELPRQFRFPVHHVCPTTVRSVPSESADRLAVPILATRRVGIPVGGGERL